MKLFSKYILLGCLSLLVLPVSGAEDDAIGCDAKSYECYQKKVETHCTKSGLPWTKYPDFGKTSICKYSEFSEAGMESGLACIRDNGSALKSLVLDTVAFRTVEIARQTYRMNMNSVFACAVIASRYDKLERLESAIAGNSQASDIQESLKKEQKRYESLMASMNCNQNRTDSAEDKVVDRLSASAMKEYCSYTYYLDYLEANIQNDFSTAEKIDATIGEGAPNTISHTTDVANRQISGYMTRIASERTRAHETVPKAILAYQEMDRTYIVHILLVTIFDDYLKLRDALDTYLSLISQTFEKTFNAQDANQR